MMKIKMKLKRENRKQFKTKTKKLKTKTKCQNNETCHSTKVLAYNTVLMGATAVRR